MHPIVLAILLSQILGSFAVYVYSEDTIELKCETPISLTKYDFANPEDLYFARLLSPLVSGDTPDDWGVLSGLSNQLGDWIDQFVAANRIANTINHALPVDGQPALKKIDDIVSECSKILHVEKPVVFVRSSQIPMCYLVEAGEKNFIILTSALLRLFEGKESELRFIVGHELGHLKCNHSNLKTAAYGVLVAIQGINLSIVPDSAQVLLPTLALGRLCSWMRESEISADRAGLLCCQDPQVAFNALARLLSGLNADSTWIDPTNPNFDANALVKEKRRWENEPFVEFIQHVKRFPAESPFIPERVAALKIWADSNQWKEVIQRTPRESEKLSNLIIVFDAISLSGLAANDASVDPYVIVYDESRELFSTSVVKSTREATWRDLNRSSAHLDGKPYFIEIWDSNYGTDTLIAGFTVRPIRDPMGKDTAVLQAPLVWDWKTRSNITRQGIAQVRVHFKERVK